MHIVTPTDLTGLAGLRPRPQNPKSPSHKRPQAPQEKRAKTNEKKKEQTGHRPFLCRHVVLHAP